MAPLVADEVDAADMHAYPVGRHDAVGLPPEVGAGDHEPAGHDAIGEHAARVVDIGQERLQGAHPLAYRPDEQVPLDRVDDAGHQVERERALLTGVREASASARYRRSAGASGWRVANSDW